MPWPRAVDTPPVLATVVMLAFVGMVGMRVAANVTQLVPRVPPAQTAASLSVDAEIPSRATIDKPSVDVGLEDAKELAARNLLIPVDGVRSDKLRDNYDEKRGTARIHEALDIMAPRGTKVFAVEGGKVAKLFKSAAGGLTVYQFDPSERYIYYYAHLDRYAEGLAEGQVLKRGDVLGYVGSTGNASPTAPHLHFTIFRLGPAKRWWKGKPINPYPFLAQSK